jgi:predicted amidohydrolase
MINKSFELSMPFEGEAPMKNICVAAVAVRNLIGQADQSLRDLERWVGMAREQEAELARFPELNLHGYIPRPVAHSLAESITGPATEQVVRMAGRSGVTIAIGMIEQEAGIVGKQRKIHVPRQEKPFWEAGEAIETFDIGKARVGITICRDSLFDEMTRRLYFKGAEIVLMPFGYYNVPRSRYLKETIHGMSLIKAGWTNGFFCVACNSAEGRDTNEWEPKGVYPGNKISRVRGIRLPKS